MLQDPTRLSTLLTSLKGYSKAASTLIVVRDGIPRALALSVMEDGSIKVHACADSFTRTIAEAHDDARKFQQQEGREQEAVSAEQNLNVQKVFEPDNLTAAAGTRHNLSAAVLLPMMSALKSYLGPSIPALAEQMIKEIETAITTAEILDATCLNLTDIPQMATIFDGFPDIEAKLNNVMSSLQAGETEKATHFLDGALEMTRTLDRAIYK